MILSPDFHLKVDGVGCAVAEVVECYPDGWYNWSSTFCGTHDFL